MKIKLSKFALRTITSVVYITIILLLLIFDNRFLATAVAGIASLLAVYEYFTCVDLKKSPYMIFGLILSLLTTTLILLYQDAIFVYFSSALVFVMAISFIIAILSNSKYSFKQVATAIVGYIYTIFLIMFLSRIFFADQGNIKVALLLTIVILTDTFAFLIGRKLGKHKLTKISPNKTIEGAVSGLIAAVIGTIIYTIVVNTYFLFELSYPIMIVVAILLSIISQIGDLIASYIKREYNKKDFGNILVGHGGILDRIDSLIFTAPFAYLIITFLM